MDYLYQLFCIPKPPTLGIHDLKKGNFNQFLDTSMRSAESIQKDTELQADATKEISRLIASKSHSASNTLRTINTMFESASKVCHLDRERALIEWLQVCVSTAVKFGLSSNSVQDLYAYYSEKPLPVNPTTAESDKSKNIKKQPKKKVAEYEYCEAEISSDEDGGNRYEFIGSSDDDYVPTDQDDLIVPSGRKPNTRKSNTASTVIEVQKTTAPKKKAQTRKKKNEDQLVPTSGSKVSKEAILPVLKEGAGPKAVQKYFVNLDTKEIGLTSPALSVLSNGYFARAFFFPSKDSFNAFISVLNSAIKTIDICVYAFTDDDVANALIAAKKRGVSIKIITDNQQAAGKGADAKRLQEAYNIPYKTDRSSGYMHNKFAIIDSTTLINGSFNWSKGARFKNRENILITNIPICIKEFQKQFDALWEEF
ncbi:uncharacterized protein BX663DRAFT_500657 [Cokeromyces recurvatus]|uniref:uncharacterized protein n=1 Tax=Cokeromyces recurvatus TaxID=90255 RepID=UPI00221F8CAB|nr:uncharacterized protein BX663DRAFT_500657 [Cokeromyces recurvatus]KAI7905718.1 hypothetical protein BX663DRAFT_500657 [Cokeromyces recurvatus]